MKRWYLILGLVAVLPACRGNREANMLQLQVFEQKDKTKPPTADELARFGEYSAAGNHAQGSVQKVGINDLQTMGYTFRFSSGGELKGQAQEICNQGIQWGEGGGMAIVASVKPAANGGSELKLNYRKGSEVPDEAKAKTVNLTVPGGGVVVFDNGLVVSWSANPWKL